MDSQSLQVTITYILMAIISIISGSPPGIRPDVVTDTSQFSAESEGFAKFVESCRLQQPGNQLCSAYMDTHVFYSRLVPNQNALLNDAFGRFPQTDIDELCRALSLSGATLKSISKTHDDSARYFKTLTQTDICVRRCSELDNIDDSIHVRPICKVIAYELQEIASLSAPVATSSNSAVVLSESTSLAAKSVVSPVLIPQSSAPATSGSLVNSTTTGKQPDSPSVPLPNVTSSHDDKRPIAVVAVTPAAGPAQPAEDVQPAPAVVISTKGSSTTSSTVDYSNVLASNNNAPDESINKLSGIETKQSEQPQMGGSLDNEYMGAGGTDEDGDDNGDYEQTLEEQKQNRVVAPKEDRDNDENAKEGSDKKVKSKEEAGRDGVESLPKSDAQQTHNKKPTRLTASSEMEMGHQKQVIDDPFYEEEDSNFFAYFMLLMAMCVLCYVGYHNKSKVLALLLEGRRSSSTSGRGSANLSMRRSSSRKHTANYHKLDSNLEEAITSTGQSRTTQIIY